MDPWKKLFTRDPVPTLLACGDPALAYFARRDLLDEKPGPRESVWALPPAAKLFAKQRPDGSFRRAGKSKHPAINDGLIGTWKQFRFIIDQYGFDRTHAGTARAAEFIFSCQTGAGDIRGMLADQYMTYYTGALLALLIKAGYGNDPRVEKGLRWLLSMRQDDGAWSIPLMTHTFDRQTQYRLTSEHASPVEPDRGMPFSHNATGMIIRAFAAHPRHRRSAAAKRAANLLKGRFFREDAYASYRSADYWLRFQFPFWWNNLVAALDSISLIDKTVDEPVGRALEWFARNQEKDGLWPVACGKTPVKPSRGWRETRLWVGLSVARFFRRFAG